MPIVNPAGSDTLASGLESPVVHLIACGPSIADIDYAALDLGNVLGVNGAIALASRYSVKFTHYCITDTGFLRNRPDLVATILSQDLVLFTTPVALAHILHHFPHDKIKCRIFLLERVGEQAFMRRQPVTDVIEHAHGDLTLFEPSHGLGFSHDIERGVFPGGTVAYEALQILTWLGFQQIYLHGIDLSNADQAPRFYENEGDKQPCHLTEQLEAIIKPSFREASKLLRKKGIRVLNLSQRSALTNDIFPVVEWQSLIQSGGLAGNAA
jgi:Kdo-III transferase WaaZ